MELQAEDIVIIKGQKFLVQGWTDNYCILCRIEKGDDIAKLILDFKRTDYLDYETIQILNSKNLIRLEKY